MLLLISRVLALTAGWCALLSLSGCATAIPGTGPVLKPTPAVVSYVPVCPKLVDYSSQDYDNLDLELRTTQDVPEMQKWIMDYVGLRDAIKKCQQDAAHSATGKQ